MVASAGALALALLHWEKQGHDRALVVSTVPIAIFANVFRVTLTGILASAASPELAEGFFHYFSGLLVFAFGLVGVLVFAALLRLVFPVPAAVERP